MIAMALSCRPKLLIATNNAGKVRTDNTNGAGKVIAKDRVSGFVDVYYG